TPAKPVISAEPCYENTAACPRFETCTDTLVRLEAWDAFLSGAAGHVYGAKGVFFLDDLSAINLPGSSQLAKLGAFMKTLHWWELDKAADCITINAKPPSLDPNAIATRSQPRCAGGRGTYVAYLPEGNSGDTIALHNIANGTY